MQIEPTQLLLLLGAFLFSIGVFILITKSDLLLQLIGIELLFNAANVNFVAFSFYDPNFLQGQIFSLFVFIVSVCEISIAIAIFIQLYKKTGKTKIEEISNLKDN